MSLYFTSLLDQDGLGRPVNPPGRSQQLIGTTSTGISESGGIWCTTGRSHRIPADSMYGLEIFSSHLFNSFACVRFISLHAGIVLRDQHARSFYLFPVACNLFFFLEYSACKHPSTTSTCTHGPQLHACAFPHLSPNPRINIGY
jgi:hypothetical protein